MVRQKPLQSSIRQLSPDDSCNNYKRNKSRDEKVVVFVVPEKDASERAIKKELNIIYKKNLAKYEIPREIRFLAELPKTKLAKVDFKALESL